MPLESSLLKDTAESGDIVWLTMATINRNSLILESLESFWWNQRHCKAVSVTILSAAGFLFENFHSKVSKQRFRTTRTACWSFVIFKLLWIHREKTLGTLPSLKPFQNEKRLNICNDISNVSWQIDSSTDSVARTPSVRHLTMRFSC